MIELTQETRTGWLVVSVRGRADAETADELENGYLKPSDLEIVRLANDPNYPENGKISFEMHGGM